VRAALFVGTDQPLSIEDVKPAPPGPQDVVVEIGASGVCHSDLSLARGYVPLPPGVILGHEGAGRVVEVGKEVTKVKKGDRIVASFVPACGTCWFCLHENSNLCEFEPQTMMTPRGTRSDGSPYLCMTGLGTFAEAITASEHSVVKIDSDVPDAQLALIGCGVTTGVGAALNTARVQPGSTVAVLGCGGVGQAVIQGARIAGAARIIAVDTVAMKREQAKKFGATDVVDPKDGDAASQVKSLTGGRGADYAFEVIGLPETIVTTYNMARNGGTVCIVGMSRADAMVTFPAFQLFYEEKKILGSKYGSAQVRRDFQRFIDLIETGRLDTEHMVSRTIKLAAVNDAFRAMEAGEVIRSVIA
jgi:S-(hydroxymethyl)glutathione dehydrogenase / alcohol dehydrogenase